MPVIRVNFKGKKIKDHILIIGDGCNIGRKQGNDIVIDHLSVSGTHARIDSVSTDFVLKDLDSTNGTFVNDKKITTHSLEHNDTILIGKHELVFDCSDLDNMKSNESELSEAKTRVLNVDDLRELAGWTTNDSVNEGHHEADNPDKDEQRNASFLSKVIHKLFR